MMVVHPGQVEGTRMHHTNILQSGHHKVGGILDHPLSGPGHHIIPEHRAVSILRFSIQTEA